jgi:hypothetical protein
VRTGSPPPGIFAAPAQVAREIAAKPLSTVMMRNGVAADTTESPETMAFDEHAGRTGRP